VSAPLPLRTRLTLVLVLLTAGIGVAAVIGVYAVVERQLRADVDDFLRVRSDQIVRIVQGVPARTGRPGGGPLAGPTPAGSPQTALFQPDALAVVRLADGTVVARSTPGLELPFDDADRTALAAARPSWRDVTLDGEPYRLLTLPFGPNGIVQVARGLGDTEAALSRLAVTVAVAAAAAAAAAGLAGILVARRVSRPITALAGAAEQVAATQDLDTPVPVEGDRETARLAESFNTMLAALSASRDQQRRLVRDASHELRTPLTSLRTNLQHLRRAGDLPAEERSEVLAASLAEVDELTSLTEELVELATDGRTDEPVAPIPLEELAAAVVQRESRRGRCPVTLTVHDPAVVEGRWARLERAVGNLVDNACKFSPPGSPVEVTVTGHLVEVRDHGPGIDAADLPRVFDRFFRSERTRGMPGSGLGLAIVQAVADQHGAVVTAANAPDGGAVFRLAFPVR
jgi:two-component system sensor histidine kinase MprB